MGGTGKTPTVLALIKLLENSGKKVGVLTRGYKSGAQELVLPAGTEEIDVKQIGDEPAVILLHLQNGVLGVGAKRYQVGKKILKENPVDLFLLDDGFQHRKLHRELDICLIDVSRWSSHPLLFPFSYLRDHKASLHRADLIILTKFERRREAAKELKTALERKYSVPVFSGEFQFRSLVYLNTEAEVELSRATSQKVAAFCGIANPDSFFDMLTDLGFELVYRKRFPDHHNFKDGQIKKIKRDIKKSDADLVVVTEKDAVKLYNALPAEDRFREKILVMRISFQLQGDASLKRMLLAKKFIT